MAFPPTNDGDHNNASPAGQLGLQLTSEEVDDALNFDDLDFDTMAETMGDALPNIDCDGAGSLGTRSPSPSESGSGSVLSKGSKRSRAEFDSESECDSNRDGGRISKRMSFNDTLAMSRSGSGLGLCRSGSGLNMDQQQYQQQQQEGSNNMATLNQNAAPGSPTKVIRRDREREGRCPDCGLDTHRIVMTENGFELQPLTIEGEVFSGRCLLCNPLKEGETFNNYKVKTKKGGVRQNQNNITNGESPSNKKKGGRKSGSDMDKNEPELARLSPHLPRAGPNHTNTKMSPPPHQIQRQQMMRTMKLSPTPQHNLPFPPPGRDNGGSSSSRQQQQQQQQRLSSGGSSIQKFTPTPNQYHSKMALIKQAQLPRKHSWKQHAMLVFGNTNNRGGGSGGNTGRKKHLRRKSSNGSGVVGGNNKPGPPGSSGSGMWQPPERGMHSSNASLSSVSCSEVESQTSLGGLGKAMAMGMGMHCTETSSAIQEQHHTSMPQLLQQQQQQRSMPSREQSPHPQTPQFQNRRSPSDPPLTRSGSSAQTPQPVPVNMLLSRSGSSAQTPQSVPINMNNIMSSRMMQTPQSVPANMTNMMSARMGGGGGGGGQQVQSSQSMSSMHDMTTIMGNVPPAVRMAHSKLQSSIYHHHIYPMNDEMERAYVEKTLAYLEIGSGDISDIIVAMRRFPFSLAIQRVSCEKLYAHCFDQEHAHAIGLVGGIRTIIDAMEHHPEDIALQRGCAGVIKHLASASTYNLEMLDKMNAVGIIVATMERHPKCAPLLESCCWAMESMSRSSNPEIKMRVAKGGGIHSAMKAVEIFPNNESLLRAAFHCLRQLGYNPSSYNSSMQGQQQQQQQRQHGSNSQQQSQQQQQHKQQKQQQQQQKHGSNNSQQQLQQVPSFVSHRGSLGTGGGSGGTSRGGGGGGGMMMPNNMMGNNNPMNNPAMMGKMMGNNNNPMNNSMMGNTNPMMGNSPMMSPMMGNNNMNMGNNPMMGNNNINNMSNNNNMNSNRRM